MHTQDDYKHYLKNKIKLDCIHHSANALMPTIPVQTLSKHHVIHIYTSCNYGSLYSHATNLYLKLVRFVGVRDTIRRNCRASSFSSYQLDSLSTISGNGIVGELKTKKAKVKPQQVFFFFSFFFFLCKI